MQTIFDAATIPRSTAIFAAPAAEGTWRLPDRHKVEDGMSRALEVIRHCARIAWWDGSSVGLHLHGYAGMFGVSDVDCRLGCREERR